MQLFDYRGRQIQFVEEGLPPVAKFAGAGSLAVIPVGGSRTRGLSDAIIAYRQNPSIWGIVNKIATEVSKIEWVALQSNKQESRDLLDQRRPASKYAQQVRGISTRNADDLVESGDFTLLERGSQWLDAWQEGNEYMSPFDVRLTMVANYLLAGEVYLFQVDSQAGLPIEYYPVPSLKVERRERQGVYSWDARDGDFELKDRPRDRVFQWRAADPNAPYSTVAGMGGAVASEISADELAAQVIRGRFTNSGTPPGIIVVRGATPDQLEELTELYDRRNATAQVAKPMISNEDVSYVQVGESFGGLAMHEQRTFLRKNIRQAIGMPPEILGDVDNSNRSTIETAKLIVAESVYTPILQSMADFLNRKPRRSAGTEDFLSFVNPIPVDIETRLDLMKTVPEVFTVNQFLTAAGYPAMTGPEGEMTHRDYMMAAAQAIADDGGFDDDDDDDDED